QNWNFPVAANPNNGKSPLLDPFPVRADGSRFDVPTGNALGLMAKAGRGFGFTDFNQPHPRQQRWQLGLQRQVGKSWVVEAGYAGSYSDKISIGMKQDYLPEQYWASGTTRNDAIANNLNANVTNPFLLRNFASLQQTSPLIYQDISTNGFFTSPTIRKHQLLREFPQNNNGLTNNTVPVSYTRSDEFQLQVTKRFSQGFNLNAGYTAMNLREADFFYYEWDRTPTERPSNDGRPHRIVASSIFELPFGKGKRFLNSAGRLTNTAIGGWQLSATYEYQPGPLLDWGATTFYYGSDQANIANVSNRTYDTWFNTADFEGTAARGANSFHRRVFPTRIEGIRRDMTNQWNANVSKNIVITERAKMQLRLDALNLTNRSQMASPSTDTFSGNFGRVTAQTAATNRWIQVQARLTF
ncbi:MAG: hypothetical protein SGI92_14460, partial [Bryobacteraceae bacterium]|nr:hypothetical protein [Bryobacteraceae bacterium]